MSKNKLAVFASLLVLPMLAGCNGFWERFEPAPPIKQNVFVPATVPETFFSPTACPSWPTVGSVVGGTDQEASDYMFAGYEAYRCERTTRLDAGVRQAEIKKDIEARNAETTED
jgi:hypothetical protein